MDEIDLDELLETVRKQKMLAVSPDGSHLTERNNAMYYYEGELHQANGDDAIPKIEGRSSVTAMTLAETVETMMPVIMDIVTDKETIAFKRRKGEEAEVSQKETGAVFSMIYEDNDGWQVVYDAIWNAAVGRYGVAVVGNDVDEYGQSVVTLYAADPADVLYVPSAKSAESSPYWGVVYRMDKQDFAERFNRDPDEYASAPLTETQRITNLNSYGVAVTDDNVGVIEHYVRMGRKWVSVVTDFNSGEVLDYDVHERLPLIWFTLFRRPHSLVGWSVFDRVKGPQKVETTMMRLAMDTAQFAQTNRPVVNMEKVLPQTIDALSMDAPSVPIPVKGDGAITPLYQNQGIPFDVFGMLEHNSAQVEARAGVGRNMQGVNAEALHETATVGAQMENRQQMRVRTLARHIAENSMRPLFEAVHYMARKIGAIIEQPNEMGEPEEMNAADWQAPKGCTAIVDIKGGSEALAAQAGVIKGVITDLVTLQGGPSGPFVNGEHILKAAKAMMSAAGVPDADEYVAEEFVQPPPAQPQDPTQTPEFQAKATELQMKAQLEQQKMQQDYELKMAQLEAEIGLKREQMAAEMQLKREQMILNAKQDDSVGSDVRFGGDVG